MTRYRFTKDFPPTEYKKGDLIEENQHMGNSHYATRENIALLLATGIIEEIKDESVHRHRDGTICEFSRKEKLNPEVNNGGNWGVGEPIVYEKEKCCPPHDLIPHGYTGVWGGSVPPPTKICRKCLMTI